MTSKPASTARLAAFTKSFLSWLISEMLMLRGVGWCSLKGSVLGPYTSLGQPLTSSVAVAPALSQGATQLALRPAWASWIAMFVFWLCAKSTFLRSVSMWASSQIPASLIRQYDTILYQNGNLLRCDAAIGLDGGSFNHHKTRLQTLVYDLTSTP